MHGYVHISFFWLHSMARGILVSPPGMEPVPLALEAWSRNPWTAKEVPVAYFS